MIVTGIVHPESFCSEIHGYLRTMSWSKNTQDFRHGKTWMENGPTYRPGDSLQDHVNPVCKSSKINNVQSDIFSLRFWKDGTPRLSAYEYQGLLQSQCHTKPI